MSGCLEGYTVIAQQLFDGLEEDAVLKELDAASSKSERSTHGPQMLVFYSSTNTNPIITMRNGSFTKAPAMAISNGKIIAVGSLEEARSAAGSDAPLRDLESRCVVPGFVEPHLHIILSGMVSHFLNNFDPLHISQEKHGGPTFDDALRYICRRANMLEPGAWLVGYGFDPSRYEPDENHQFRDLTFDLFKQHGLDQRNPIFITNASGHLAYANQKAFELAHICPESANPDYYPQEPSGTFVGVCVEPASYQPFLKLFLLKNIGNIPKIFQGMTDTAKEWSQAGFTTIFDAGIGMIAKFWDVKILHHLKARVPLRITGAAANLTPDSAESVVSGLNMPEGGATSLKIKTIKMWMDGTTQGFTAALDQPYELDALPSYFQKEPNGWARWDVPSSSPIHNKTQGPIVDEMLKWAKRGYQLMVHVNGDCAAEVVLKAFEHVRSISPSLLHRLEHFTITNTNQVQRAKELNLGVSHTIGHVKYWGNTFQKNIFNADKDERAPRIDPVKEDFVNGVVYSFNSDSPVSKADALSFVSTAASRLLYDNSDNPTGQQLGPEQCVSVEAALAGVTINAAQQILLDKEIGSLEAGKDANFVVLSQDISAVSVKPEDISSKWVSETWFEGANVYTASSK
jgi:hypothetical protein